MSGARGDALDWALALAEAPAERDALRQRPLPDGIVGLLQIAAGGHGGALQAAMARTGESESTLVEAVRFYLREVLFHSGADAYRMLGLSHDASGEEIKGHHRLLQLWLHPDRHTSDWDAVFAGRVNAAWNALRTPERRAAYDASRPVRDELFPAHGHRPAPRLRAGDPMVVEPAAERWRRRAPVLALFAACAVLGLAAVRDALREPGDDYATAGAPAKPAVDAQGVALQLPQPPPVVATKGTTRPATLTPTPKSPVGGRSPAHVPQVVSAARTTTQATPEPPAAANLQRAAVPRPRPAVGPMVATPAPTAAALNPTPEVTIRANVRANDPIAAASSNVPPQPPSAKPTVAVPAAAAPASPERVWQAQRAGTQLLAFLSGTSTALPPIWDSLAAQQRAVALRERLRTRGAEREGDPLWRVGDDQASLRVSFGGAGQVRAQLVWREQAWLVSGLTLEQGR